MNLTRIIARLVIVAVGLVSGLSAVAIAAAPHLTDRHEIAYLKHLEYATFDLIFTDMNHRLDLPPVPVCDRLFDPVWSPDGRWLAFEYSRRIDERTCIEERGIALIDARNGSPHYLTVNDLGVETGGAALSWSPDSSTLAFIGRVDGNPSLNVMDVANATVTTLTNLPLVQGAVWTSDSERVIYQAISPAGDHSLYRYNLTDGTTDQLLAIDIRLDSPEANYERLREMVVSPNGQYLAATVGYGSDEFRRNEVVIVDIKSGNLVRSLGNFPAMPYNLVWSPDSNQLAYHYNSPFGNSRTFAQDVSSGKPILETDGTPRSWSSHGLLIFQRDPFPGARIFEDGSLTALDLPIEQNVWMSWRP